jgi:hypothetical protein
MPLPLFLLPDLARAADVSTRNDASAGCIVGERDYVASFLATLRNLWRLLGGTAELFSAVLSPTMEQRTGCDYAIVLQTDHLFKLVLFEAKWVRPRWDSRRYPTAVARARYFPAPAPVANISRFSDQIARQSAWITAHPGHFIAEMFLQVDASVATDPPYNNPALFDQLGSTFVPHMPVSALVQPPVLGGIQFPATRLWHAGVAGPQIVACAGHVHVQALLEQVVDCAYGEPMPGTWDRHFAALLAEDGIPANQVDFPPPLARLGLRHLLVVDGTSPERWGQVRANLNGG